MAYNKTLFSALLSIIIIVLFSQVGQAYTQNNKFYMQKLWEEEAIDESWSKLNLLPETQVPVECTRCVDGFAVPSREVCLLRCDIYLKPEFYTDLCVGCQRRCRLSPPSYAEKCFSACSSKFCQNNIVSI
jgi:hypothetical protein